MCSKRIQNYILHETDPLGKGSFSTVYKAFDEIRQQCVAIKVVELASLKSAKLEELLQSETAIMDRLKHPNVLQCYDILTSSKNCYIVTELCEGDLESLVIKKGPLPEDKIHSWVRDIYSGLRYLASENIVHRDLKTSNIFIKQNRLKIADFGFAKKSKVSFADVRVGSPLYMSPEGFLKQQYGPKTDVWAFGIIIYELTHGRPLNSQCRNQQQLAKNITNQIKMTELRYDISSELKQLIVRCLDVNQNSRISIEEIKNSAYMKKLQKIDPNQRNSLKMKSMCPKSNDFSVKRTQQSSNKFPFQSENNQHSQKVRLAARQNERYQRTQTRSQQYKFITAPHQLSKEKRFKRKNSKGKVSLAYFQVNSFNKQELSYENKRFSSKETRITLNPTEQNRLSKNASQMDSVSNSQRDEIKEFSSGLIRNKSVIDTSSRFMNYTNNRMTERSVSPLANNYTNFKFYENFKSSLLGKKKPQYENEINSIINPCPTKLMMEKEAVKQQQKTLERYLSVLVTDGQISTREVPSVRFPNKMQFLEVLGIVNYCRLCFKFMRLRQEMDSTKEWSRSSCFEWVIGILEQIIRLIQMHMIDFQKSKNKQRKFREVVEEYIAKYKKQYGENNQLSSKNSGGVQLSLTKSLLSIFVKEFRRIDDSLPQNYSQKCLKAAYYILHICYFTQQIAQCQLTGDFSAFGGYEFNEIIGNKKQTLTMDTYLTVRKTITFQIDILQ